MQQTKHPCSRTPSCSSIATEETKPDADADNGHTTCFDESPLALDLSNITNVVATEVPSLQGQSCGLPTKWISGEQSKFPNEGGVDVCISGEPDRHSLSSENGDQAYAQGGTSDSQGCSVANWPGQISIYLAKLAFTTGFACVGTFSGFCIFISF